MCGAAGHLSPNHRIKTRKYLVYSSIIIMPRTGLWCMVSVGPHLEQTA